MPTVDNLRREIEIRLERQTQYVLHIAMRTPGNDDAIAYLKDEMVKNDKQIKLIGQFLKNNGDVYEDYIDRQYPDRFIAEVK